MFYLTDFKPPLPSLPYEVINAVFTWSISSINYEKQEDKNIDYGSAYVSHTGKIWTTESLWNRPEKKTQYDTRP